MKPNMGTIDKSVRIAAAVAIAILYFTNIISGTLAVILFILAGIFIITGFIIFCPVYHFLGISTNHKSLQSQEK